MARILVVEDEPLIAMMVQDWLVELGHDPVGPVTTVADALRAIESGDFDGVILDVNLRGERCDRVAKSLADQGKPFAFATGDGTGIPDAGAGPRPTLSKPYDYEAFARVVALLTEQAQSRSAATMLPAVESRREPTAPGE